MSEVAPTTFTLLRLYFPRIDGSFIKLPSTNSYNQTLRVAVSLYDDHHLIILLGIQLISDEKDKNDKPSAALIVECAAEIELNKDLGQVNSLDDIPLAANMLAMLFPFLREKVNYFFSNNHVQLLLNPINTLQLTKEMKPGNGLEIFDVRDKKIETKTTTV